MPNSSVYRTRDLYLAATLMSLKFPLLNIDVVAEGTKNHLVGYFVFADTPIVREAETRYLQGLLTVEPRGFVSNMHGLKSKIVAAQNEEGFTTAK